MGLVDFLTGGKSGDAEDALKQAQARLAMVKAPSIQELTLPELQKYVQAGILTPEMAQAVLIQGNAYDNISTDSRPVEAEMSALSKMQDIADAGGLDNQAKSALLEARNNANVTAQGQRGSIIDQMAARGIPTSLISEALQSAAVGQDAQNENLADTKAAGDAEARALQALSDSATLGGQIHGQQYNEASNKAAAANAINQWNAANQTAVNQSNATAKNNAAQLNLGNSQDISNRNVETSNKRTEYNAQLPQQVFNNQVTKATGQANIANNQANQLMQEGQQEAGLWSGIIGTGGKLLAAAEGGTVPGHASVPGNSPKNDKVHTMLSPGEVVIPRTIAQHPEAAKQFVAHVMRNKTPLKPVSHEDVRTVLDALTSRREAA